MPPKIVTFKNLRANLEILMNFLEELDHYFQEDVFT